MGIEGIEGYRMVAVKTMGSSGKISLRDCFSVCQGNYFPENITSEVKDDFIAEIEILKKIGHHPNIVKLLGCCTSKIPYLMIMELVPCGDLKNYLLDLRKQWRKGQQHTQIFFPT